MDVYVPIKNQSKQQLHQLFIGGMKKMRIGQATERPTQINDKKMKIQDRLSVGNKGRLSTSEGRMSTKFER